MKISATITGLVLALIALLGFASPRVTVAQDELTPYLGAWQGYIMIKFLRSPLWPNGGVDQITEKALHDALTRLIPERGAWPPYNAQIGPWNLARTAVIIEGRWDMYPRKRMIVDLFARRLNQPGLMVDAGIELTIFGGDGTYEESQAAVTEYMRQNLAQWQKEDQP